MTVNLSDGGKVVVFNTPCGFEITLVRTGEGDMKMMTHIQGVPVTFTNSQYRLSADGARMFHEKLGELYAIT